MATIRQLERKEEREKAKTFQLRRDDAVAKERAERREQAALKAKVSVLCRVVCALLPSSLISCAARARPPFLSLPFTSLPFPPPPRARAKC